MKLSLQTLLAAMAVWALSLFATGCGKSGGAPPTAAARPARYHCAMHPSYVSDRPGDCPICGMKLVLIEAGGETPGAPGVHAVTNAVPGRVTVTISPDKQQRIGVRFSTVRARDLSYTIRTTGTLQHDETALARIAPRFGGWVRKLYVNYTGQQVEQGEPLLTVYSPELLATESEYLLAWRQVQQAKNGAADQREAAERLLDSARRRLELWQVGDEEIRALEQRGQPGDELLIRAPISGHVIAKDAVEGKSFAAGETLYELGTLHRLWVVASIYEYELPLVHVGQKARVVLPYFGEKTFETTVAFIYPHIDPRTRRAEVRMELENASHELRPNMWADVEIGVALGNVLSVPQSAVIDTGTRQLAFVKADAGHFEPRELRLGVRSDDFVQVLEGLKDGEKVVTRALFLVDSESQLKAAIAGMGAEEAHP